MFSAGFNLTYTYGTRLRYMGIQINTTINGRTLGYPEGLPIRDAWEEMISEQVKEMTRLLQICNSVSVQDRYCKHVCVCVCVCVCVRARVRASVCVVIN